MVGLCRSTLYYTVKPGNDDKLTARILELAKEKKRWGAPLIHSVVKREKLVCNHKRTERIYYKVLKLSLKRRTRKKFHSIQRVSMSAPTGPNQCWAIDFVHDCLNNGRKYKVLNVLDEYTRECIGTEVDTSIGGVRVTRILERLCDIYGKPESIRSDNGPEFTSKAMDEWAYRKGVTLNFIAPGKPTQNAFVESFNGTMREDCLNSNWFGTIEEARSVIENWREEYNGFRPHSSLKGMTSL